MLDITPREVTLLEAAAAAIESLPDVRVYSQLYKGRAALKGVPDLVLETYIGGQPRTIFIEAKAHGYPRDVRQAISRLRALAPLDTEQGQALMVVAPAITKHARELLREEEVGYWDLSGSLYLKPDKL